MFGLSTLAIQVILAAVIAVTSFGAGWRVNSWKHDAEYAAQMEGANKALEATAKELAKLEVKQVTIKQEVQTHVIEKPVYRECQHDDDTFRLLNEALTNGKSASNSKLPRESGGIIRQIFRGNNDETGGSK
jgi:hypothetical protein